jgi:formyl-CoA transferase
MIGKSWSNPAQRCKMQPEPMLAGTRVVGLEHSVAGPLCTRILGDLGADVIKIERPPAGDFSRHWDVNAAGDGAQFWWLNRRKRSIALDLRTSAGRETLDRLLASSDVLVQNMSPRAAERLGLADPGFDARYPSLVHCHISGYGSAGAARDRKAYDMLVQAEAGLMSLTGTAEQAMRTGVSVCDVGTGIYAAALVLGALIEQRSSGRGRRIDLAMFDAAVEMLAPMLVSYANAEVQYSRIPDRHPAIAPYGVFRCADGEDILIAVEQQREWELVCEHVLGDGTLADDPRFGSNAARIAHREELDPLMAAAIGRLTLEAATELFDRLELAYAHLNDVARVAEHPVTLERGILASVANADGAPVRTLVGVAERTLAPGAPGRLRPPRLGEDTDEILRQLEQADVREATG